MRTWKALTWAIKTMIWRKENQISRTICVLMARARTQVKTRAKANVAESSIKVVSTRRPRLTLSPTRMPKTRNCARKRSFSAKDWVRLT